MLKTVWLFILASTLIFEASSVTVTTRDMGSELSEIVGDVLSFLTLNFNVHLQLQYVSVESQNLEAVTQITVPDLNRTIYSTQRIVDNASSTKDLVIPLPIFGKDNYTYQMKTVYYTLGGAFVSQVSQSDVLSVPSYMKWVWLGCVLTAIFLFIGFCVIVHWRYEKRKKQKAALLHVLQIQAQNRVRG